MEVEPKTYTVDELLKLKNNHMLVVNPEYQRGAVWKPPQKKRFMDSLLRGYPVPAIYLHHIQSEPVAGYRRDNFEIIDGQQRINAIYEFSIGAFPLFDPLKDQAQARFPTFIREAPCPWGGKDFDALDSAIRNQLLGTKLPVAKITTNEPNEARDLFLRLQAGMPLNAQEKRDAWPGGFTDFVLKMAGKPEIERYPGHPFFKVLMGATKNNRGQFRQLAAQMAMLFFSRHKTDGQLFCRIGSRAIDDFYYENLDFEPSSSTAGRFGKILDELVKQLDDGTRSKIVSHEAIHLLLLVDSLLDDYVPFWVGKLSEAFDLFRENLAKDKLTRNDPTPGEFWLKYGNLLRVSGEEVESFEVRHRFFCEKMFQWLSPIPRDPKRLFGPVEREIIYYRDKKRCYFCRENDHRPVPWSEAEIHHLKSHAQGGRTTLENGVLAHKRCHQIHAEDAASD